MAVTCNLRPQPWRGDGPPVPQREATSQVSVGAASRGSGLQERARAPRCSAGPLPRVPGPRERRAQDSGEAEAQLGPGAGPEGGPGAGPEDGPGEGAGAGPWPEVGRGYQWVVPAGRPGSLRRVLRWGKFSRRALCSPHINTNQGLFEEHSTGPPLQESRYKREPHPAPPSRQVLIVAMATDDGLDARLSSRGLPKHTQIKEVGRGAASAPPSLGWVAEAAPPTHTHHRHPHAHPSTPGCGEAGAKRLPSRCESGWGLGDGWGHRGRGPHPSHSPEERAGSGPDWKQMGPPSQAPTPDPESGEGWEEEGRSARTANPGRRCRPCGFEIPTGEAGGSGAPRESQEPREAIRERRRP